MRLNIIVLLAVAAAAVIVGCEDKNYSTDPEEISYDFGQYVHFDSTEYRMVKRDLPRYNDVIPEPLVNWEQSLGEPFTDLNGDGIYEAGVDSFLISDNPVLNQDLNHNGLYDSPDDPWTEGVPFDDIDGNGIFRPDPGNHISGYVPGLPYADYNGNSSYDGDLEAAYGIARWRTGVFSGNDIQYWLSRYDSALYRFVSDSGLNYDLPLSNYPIMAPLVLTDTALLYRLDQYTVTLLKPGTIQPEDSTPIQLYVSSPIYYRKVTLGQSLKVDGRTFSDLVKVRIGNSDYRYEFYFSRDLGILGYEYWEDHSAAGEDWTNYVHEAEYFYLRYDKNHSLIFPTRR